jgi:hypothetical protein
MKIDKKNRDMEYWLALSEKYFDALTTNEEENALSQFLASSAGNHPAFNEIKAAIGYLSTGRSIAQKAKKKARRIGNVIQWTSVAACIAIMVAVGTSIFKQNTLPATENREIFYACIDGKEYTDEEFVMQYMLATMNRMSSSGDNVIEQQMGAMFRINN